MQSAGIASRKKKTAVTPSSFHRRSTRAARGSTKRQSGRKTRSTGITGRLDSASAPGQYPFQSPQSSGFNGGIPSDGASFMGYHAQTSSHTSSHHLKQVRQWVEVMRPPSDGVKFRIAKWVPISNLTDEERATYMQKQEELKRRQDDDTIKQQPPVNENSETMKQTQEQSTAKDSKPVHTDCSVKAESLGTVVDESVSAVPVQQEPIGTVTTSSHGVPLPSSEP